MNASFFRYGLRKSVFLHILTGKALPFLPEKRYVRCQSP
jgi:hypothetical protein